MAAQGSDGLAAGAGGGMSAADLDLLGGPPQRGSNKPGQYCYWITQPRPKAEAVERLGHNNTLGGHFPWKNVMKIELLLLVITSNNTTITPSSRAFRSLQSTRTKCYCW